MNTSRLASIQTILSVEHHSNADSLDIVGVLGYKAIVKRDQWKAGDLCIFIEPDSVLPDAPWTEPYKKYVPNRIKALKLRGVWSWGLVVPLSVLDNLG